jgi:hypothetical protein
MKAWGFVLFGLVISGVALWSHWPAESLPSNATADLVVVTKSARRLDLYRGGSLLKSSSVSLGGHPLGPNSGRGTVRPLKDNTSWIIGIPGAPFTWLSISRTRILPIELPRRPWELARVAR